MCVFVCVRARVSCFLERRPPLSLGLSRPQVPAAGKHFSRRDFICAPRSPSHPLSFRMCPRVRARTHHAHTRIRTHARAHTRAHTRARARAQVSGGGPLEGALQDFISATIAPLTQVTRRRLPPALAHAHIARAHTPCC